MYGMLNIKGQITKRFWRWQDAEFVAENLVP